MDGHIQLLLGIRTARKRRHDEDVFETSSGELSPSSVTPSPTPVSGLNLGAAAPKYGTVIPNRIFVGGISGNTSEAELKAFFSAYGQVKDSKIIADRAGVSKGYGFVTFETQEDAEKIIKKESENLIFKDRKLNIGPAVRKQQAFPRPDAPFSPVMFTNGIPYTFQNGMAVFHGGQETNPYTTALAAGQGQQSAYQTVMLPQQLAYLPQPSAAAQYSQSAAAAYQSAATAALAQQAAAPQHWATAAAAAQWRWPTQCAAPTALAANAGYVYAPGMTSAPLNDVMSMYASQTAAAAAYHQAAGDLSDAIIDTHAAEPSSSAAHVLAVSPEPQSIYSSGSRDSLLVETTPPSTGLLLQTTPISKYHHVPQYTTSQVTPSPRKHYSTPIQALRGAKAPRLVSKVVNGTTINVLSPHDSILQTHMLEQDFDYAQPLTPPPTPQQLHRKA